MLIKGSAPQWSNLPRNKSNMPACCYKWALYANKINNSETYGVFFCWICILSFSSLHEKKKPLLGTSRKKGKANALLCVRERERKTQEKARLHFALKKERTSVTEYNPPSYYCSSEKLHGNRVLNGWDQSCPKLILRPGRTKLLFPLIRFNHSCQSDLLIFEQQQVSFLKLLVFWLVYS